MTTDDANPRFSNPTELAPVLGYTQAVEATGGRTTCVSAQVALDRKGEIVGEDDLEAQALRVFENLKAALGAAGAGFGEVVKLGYYLTDISRVGAVRAVRDGYVDRDNPPAR